MVQIPHDALIASNRIALVAQSAERPALNRRDAGSSPAGCTGPRRSRRGSEDGDGTVDLLIPGAGLRVLVPERPPTSAAGGERGALYFKQLLAYLREQRAMAGEQSAQVDEADELIGA